MTKPNTHPKEPTTRIAIPTMAINANNGLIRYIIPSMYTTLLTSQ